MSLFELIAIAVGLAMDASAVGLACAVALKTVTARQVFRFGFHFGLFQALMPVVGWTLGAWAHRWIASWDHWVAMGLLTFAGGRMILESLRNGPDPPRMRTDPTRGLSLVYYSISTSIDAMAVGVSLAMLKAFL